MKIWGWIGRVDQSCLDSKSDMIDPSYIPCPIRIGQGHVERELEVTRSSWNVQLCDWNGWTFLSWAARTRLYYGLEVPEMSSFVIETAGHFYHELPGQDFIMGSSWGTSIRWAFTMWNLKPSGNYLLIKDYGRFDRSLQIHGSIVITFHNIGLSVNHWILPISLGTSLYDRCPEKEGREGWQMDGSCLIIIAVHHSVTTFSRILSLPVQLLDRK